MSCATLTQQLAEIQWQRQWLPRTQVRLLSPQRTADLDREERGCPPGRFVDPLHERRSKVAAETLFEQSPQRYRGDRTHLESMQPRSQPGKIQGIRQSGRQPHRRDDRDRFGIQTAEREGQRLRRWGINPIARHGRRGSSSSIGLVRAEGPRKRAASRASRRRGVAFRALFPERGREDRRGP